MVELLKQDYENNCKFFLELKNHLIKLFNQEITIHHVGSTAIPDMVGKNIVDILIGVENETEMDSFSNILKDNGYFQGQNTTPIYRFFASTINETKSGDLHIHLVTKNTERYNEFLLLKEFLLNNKEERDNYCSLKKEILSKTTDRNEYRKLKSEYVSNLIARAKQN